MTSQRPSDPHAATECGCDFELVEDGAVQRKRWFHEPDCPLGSAAKRRDGFYAPAGDPYESGDIRCLLCGEQLAFDSVAHWHPTEGEVLARSEWWDRKVADSKGPVEAAAREYERRGNVAVANGLMLVARRQFRIADHIRSEPKAAS